MSAVIVTVTRVMLCNNYGLNKIYYKKLDSKLTVKVETLEVNARLITSVSSRSQCNDSMIALKILGPVYFLNKVVTSYI